jgi:hypothetical protein
MGLERDAIPPTIGQMLNCIVESLDPNYTRPRAITDETSQFLVDTVRTTDTLLWETGVQHLHSLDRRWTIVEQYQDEEAATEGHKQWVETLSENPEQELFDVFLREKRQYPIGGL